MLVIKQHHKNKLIDMKKKKNAKTYINKKRNHKSYAQAFLKKIMP